MTTKDYGAYSLVISTSAIISTFSFQWLSISLGRFYPAHLTNPAPLFQTINRLFWFASVGTTVVLGIVMVFPETTGLKPELVLIVACIVIMQGRFGLGLQLTNALGKPLQYGLVSCLKSFVTLLVSAALIYAGTGLQGVLAGVLVGFGIASVLFNPKSMLLPIFGKPDWRLAKQIFRYGFPFTWTLLAIMVVDFADRFIINKYLGVERVAPYAAAYDFTQYAIGMIVNVLFLSSFPAIVTAFESGGAASAQKQMRVLGQGFLFVAPVAVAGLWVLSNDVAHVVFGSAIRQEAAQVMPWIALAVMVAGFKSFYLDIAFQLTHATRLQAATAIVMAAINLGLNFVLIPLYGSLGAAWATLAAFFAGSVVSAYFAARIFPLPDMWRDSGKTALALLPMVSVLLMTPVLGTVVGLVGKLLLGAGIYLATAWLLNLCECRVMVARILTRPV
jgi:O-antigen/teichoic acid export membrane protein